MGTKESIEVRPDNGDPIVLPGPVLTDPADIVLLGVKALVDCGASQL